MQFGLSGIRFLRDGTFPVLFGSCKLHIILSDSVAAHVKLDLPTQYRALLCILCNPEASILAVVGGGFYSLNGMPTSVREARDEERLVTLLVWKHDNEVCSWGHNLSIGYCPGTKFFRKLTSRTQRPSPKAMQ